jgi:hypothetical protein
MLPEVVSASNLGAIERAQDQVGDVGNKLVGTVPRTRGEFLPGTVVTKDIPFGLEFALIGKAEHVRQVWQPGAEKGVSEEHGMKSGIEEDLKFTRVEHLHLAHMIAVAGALVGTQLEDAPALVGGCGGGSDLWPACEGAEESNFHALKCGSGGGCIPKTGPRL